MRAEIFSQISLCYNCIGNISKSIPTSGPFSWPIVAFESDQFVSLRPGNIYHDTV